MTFLKEIDNMQTKWYGYTECRFAYCEHNIDIGAENKLDVSELILLVAPFNEHTPSET